MQPSPQISWPLLNTRAGCDIWLKHENHNPTGAFKVRGGLVYLTDLMNRNPGLAGVVAATRGNHGQSVAFAAQRCGIKSTVVVPMGNSPDKNRAMTAFGADLVEHGEDFNDALDFARNMADERGLHFMPSFDPLLVRGVASYGLELLNNAPNLTRIYVPIGMGSGAAAMAAARNALNLNTELIGVVAEGASAYLQSFAAGRTIATDSAQTLADGLAVRVPDEDALNIMLTNLSRVVSVSDDEILQAMAILFTDTHNIAEGAGAAALAAALKERADLAGTSVGVILSGGNLDRALYQRALSLQDVT